VSYDSGVTWVTRAAARAWIRVAMSADGRTMLAGEDEGFLYRSRDGGDTWEALSGLGSHWGWGLAVAPDGRQMVVSAMPGSGWTGRTYASQDGGDTWVVRSDRGGLRVAMSDSGRSIMVSTFVDFTRGHQSLIEGRPDWTVESVGTDEGLAMSADGRYRFRGGISGLLASAGHGAPWTATGPQGPVGSNVACSLDCGRVYATYISGVHISRVTTMPGTTGGLAGGAGSSVELQYLGGGRWNVIGHGGTVSAY
jgi:photosystem II stability/assembly factor-like uncharacterized protein